jgi:hypothetical protein
MYKSWSNFKFDTPSVSKKVSQLCLDTEVYKDVLEIYEAFLEMKGV